MKVRISIKGEGLYIRDIPVDEIEKYIELLKTHELIDAEGALYKVDSVQFDIHQNVIDINCEPI